jgi:hypothetical protein
VFLGAPPSLKMLKGEKLPSRCEGNRGAAIEHRRAHVLNQRSGISSHIGSADDVRLAMRRRADRGLGFAEDWASRARDEREGDGVESSRVKVDVSAWGETRLGGNGRAGGPKRARDNRSMLQANVSPAVVAQALVARPLGQPKNSRGGY